MPTFSELLFLIYQHIFMVTISVFFATITAVPLAIFVYKKNFAVKTIMNLVSLLQSFPALGFFALLVPIIGIGMKTVIFVLYLYAIMPIFISTIQGFKSINPDYYIITKSLNLTKKDILFKIEIPNALPQIISGIRLTVIYSIAFATIGTLVGAGGLGDLIYLGLQQISISITLTGLIPLFILTIIVNNLLNILERKTLPADIRFKEQNEK